MKPIIVIPCRYNSTRFPGKPLAKIINKPMIRWVAERASLAYGKDSIIIATDNKLIMHEMQDYKCILTSSEAKTGTDRVAEAVNGMSNIVINIQGDEPLINYKDIIRVAELANIHKKYVISGMCSITKKESKSTKNVKVMLKSNNDLILASRLLHRLYPTKFKQVGIFGFTTNILSQFPGPKTFYESIEDVEILRFLENGINIKMLEVSSTHSVDYPKDIEIVEKLLCKQL